MNNTSKILVGVSIAAIGYVLYNQYMSNKTKKMDNAVKELQNIIEKNNTENTSAACKTFAPYIKKCQTLKSNDLIINKACDTIAPYQKMCAPYI
jgi:predicted negative regulator of RcsB-dependent stress response